jgi:hypothetical protein
MAIQYVKDETTGLIKTDETSGNPLVFDDTPDPKGEKPFALDAIHLFGKIPALQEEAKSHRLKAKEATDKLVVFDGLDPETARKALETVKNLKSGDLTKAEDVEKLKKDISTAFEAQIVEVKKGYDQKLLDAANELVQKDAKVYKLLISNMFANSEYCTGGDKSKSVLSAGMLQAFLGSHFKEEDGKIVGYDFHNNLVMSRKKPGEPADEKEALEIIIENHPEKDKILRAIPGGAGTLNSDGTPGKKAINRSQFDKMDAAAKQKYVADGGFIKD